MKIALVTQVRVGSTRLNGKILKKIDRDDTVLSLHLKRLKNSKMVTHFVVATTNEPGVEEIIRASAEAGFETYQGSLNNVLERFYKAVSMIEPDYIVRVTSDCPLIDPDLVDLCVKKIINDQSLDYVSTNIGLTYPDGFDCEVFKYGALKIAYQNTDRSSDKEHVTPYIWRNSTAFEGKLFRSEGVPLKDETYGKLRLTVDTKEDLEVVQKVVARCGKNKTWLQYSNELLNFKELYEMNHRETRNLGMYKALAQEDGLRFITNFEKSNEYRSEIHDLIPGGAHTYSKGDDQFPLLSPAAIQKGQGAYVWDIDGNMLLDCSMGLTSVSLGHAYPPITDRVRMELDNGVNFQRPSVLEREMAKEFLSLIPNHQMIKFAKNGSTATTAAVKLARAYTKRNLVAFPHDHPFYSYDDWFIGRTESSKGVPDDIKSMAVTFKAEDINSLKELFKSYPGQIACVITEPEKAHGFAHSFFSEAIPFAQSEGALFILDEMITGFKTAFPGAITKYSLDPDLATWGKGIANGFSFCALTGKKEIMEQGGIRDEGADKLFLISTTHGGETVSIAAGLQTIKEFRDKNVISHNHSIGRYFNESINSLIDEYKVADYIDFTGCDWMSLFSFKNSKGEVSLEFRTLMLQEMIRRGVLFQGAFVPCFSHSKGDVDYFSKAFEHSIRVYKDALEFGIGSYLVGPPVKPVFRKYI